MYLGSRQPSSTFRGRRVRPIAPGFNRTSRRADGRAAKRLLATRLRHPSAALLLPPPDRRRETRERASRLRPVRDYGATDWGGAALVGAVGAGLGGLGAEPAGGGGDATGRGGALTTLVFCCF
jgi:hypothetical protein